MIKFSIVGYKNSGKTTIASGLAQYFTNLGFKVGYLKHAHCEMKLDDGRDTHKVREAGAESSLVYSPQGFNFISKFQPDEAIIDFLFSGVDILIIEGDKFSNTDKLVLGEDKIEGLSNVIKTIKSKEYDIASIGNFILKYYKLI